METDEKVDKLERKIAELEAKIDLLMRERQNVMNFVNANRSVSISGQGFRVVSE